MTIEKEMLQKLQNLVQNRRLLFQYAFDNPDNRDLLDSLTEMIVETGFDKKSALLMLHAMSASYYLL